MDTQTMGEMTMDTMTYRACYWLSADRQSEVVLTRPEHATLDDAALLSEARSEMERSGVAMDGGKLVIGEWRE